MTDGVDHELLLGYVNFSDGTPSPAFQRALNVFYRCCLLDWKPDPWRQLRTLLEESLGALEGESPAFRQVDQAKSVLRLVYDEVLPAYRRHHHDLLHHLNESDLIGPFFLARVFEATLAQQGPWSETGRIVGGALHQLNDFIGHRPVAVLENDRKLEPYGHERVGLLPVYLRDVGVAVGPFEDLIDRTLGILRSVTPSILSDAEFDLELLDELALDSRAYDHTHPANQRPGYQFGEWDPERIDNQGRFRRFVMRPSILAALAEWTQHAHEIPREQALYEAAAALAGTILLASGVSGWGPGAFDSQTSLATLVPRIAQCRDQFYAEMLDSQFGDAAKRLQDDAQKTCQPFGTIRQYLNRYLAQQRAEQLHRKHLALAFARIGDPEAAREQLSAIAPVSTRMLCELQILLTKGDRHVRQGRTSKAADALTGIVDRLHAAIQCGAVVDPWNVLGFAGNYSVFHTLEDSVHDPRVDELLEIVDETFQLFTRALSESASVGDSDTTRLLEKQLLQFADFWDQFATFEVSDVMRVRGQDYVETSLFIADVLTAWRKSGTASGNIAFWHRHAAKFVTSQSYTLVVDALLEKCDDVAAMSLLMHWLSQSDRVPLEQGQFSFHLLARRWIAGVVAQTRSSDKSTEVENADVGSTESAPADVLALIKKFFDFLEANAGQYWQVPDLGADKDENPPPETADDRESMADERSIDGRFTAAYEDVVFRDSAADGQDGAIADERPADFGDAFPFDSKHLFARLRFILSLAELWQIAAVAPWRSIAGDRFGAAIDNWLDSANTQKLRLLALMGALHRQKIPKPTSSQQSILEFDRLQASKHELLDSVIDAAVEMAHAVRLLLGLRERPPDLDGLEPWEPIAIAVRRSLHDSGSLNMGAQLSTLLDALRKVPILYVPLEQQGDPRLIFRSKYVRDTLRRLAADLPVRGLFRETYRLLESALEMERTQPVGTHQVTEFNLLFQMGYKTCLEKLIDCLSAWEQTSDDDAKMTTIIGDFVSRFSKLWIEHLSNVSLSELERMVDEAEWNRTVDFIRTYGAELFTQQFMAFGNLRGIVQQGVDGFLGSLIEDQDPYAPAKIVQDLENGTLHRRETAKTLEFIFYAILEQYDAYKDYNTTTTQSDYGDNLYILLAFLRIQAGYERNRWALQPAYSAHASLCRRGRTKAAMYLEQAFTSETAKIAEGYVRELKAAEEKFGLRIATISDRVAERLVRPLQLDRVLALVEPAMQQSLQQDATGHPATETASASERLRHQLNAFGEQACGAGLEVPFWIQQLEREVDGLLGGNESSSDPLTGFLSPAPKVPITYEELQHQFDHWDDPPGPA